MATNTTNYNLVKPDAGSVNWATDLNGNFDKIDTELQSQNARVATLENDTTDQTQDNRLDSLESTTSNHETRITTLETDGSGGSSGDSSGSELESFMLLDNIDINSNTSTNDIIYNKTVSTQIRAEETFTINFMRVVGYSTERTFTLTLWDVATQTIIASTSALEAPNRGWSTWGFIEPVTLEAGKEYALTFNLEDPDNSFYHYVRAINTATIDHTIYDPRITLVGGGYADSKDTLPTTLGDLAYGPVDLGYAPDISAIKMYNQTIEQPTNENDGQTLVYDSASESFIWVDNYSNDVKPYFLFDDVDGSQSSSRSYDPPMTVGFEFRCLEDIPVNRIRILENEVRSFTVKLWDATDQSLLKTFTIDKTVSNRWSELKETELFTLEAGKDYAVGLILDGTTTEWITSHNTNDLLKHEIDPRIQIRFGRSGTNTTDFPATTTAYVVGLVDFVYDLKAQVLDDTTIQGKNVPNPTSTDDGKVLAYDSASDSYIWVAAPAGTDSGGTTDGTSINGLKMVKVGTINPSTDITSHTTQEFIATEDFTFTLEEETEVLIEGELYARELGTSPDIYLAVSPDNGTTWWYYPEPSSADFTAPAGHIGQRIRLTGSEWTTGYSGFAYGVYPAGTYLVRIYHADTEDIGIAGSNNYIKVFGQPTNTSTSTSAPSTQWFDYLTNYDLTSSGSAFNTKGLLLEPSQDITVHGISILHQHNGPVTGKIVEIDSTNTQIGEPLYQSPTVTGDGTMKTESFDLTTPITLAAGGRYVIAGSSDTAFNIATSGTSMITFATDDRTGLRGDLAPRATPTNPTSGTVWDVYDAATSTGSIYFGGVQIEV